jgi:hypothetical protein
LSVNFAWPDIRLIIVPSAMKSQFFEEIKQVKKQNPAHLGGRGFRKINSCHGTRPHYFGFFQNVPVLPIDRKSTRLNSSHMPVQKVSRMPSSA